MTVVSLPGLRYLRKGFKAGLQLGKDIAGGGGGALTSGRKEPLIFLHV